MLAATPRYALLTLVFLSALPAQPPEVRAIFEKSCYSCHGPQLQRGEPPTLAPHAPTTQLCSSCRSLQTDPAPAPPPPPTNPACLWAPIPSTPRKSPSLRAGST